MKNIQKIKEKHDEEDKRYIKSCQQFEKRMGFFDRVLLFGLPIILFILFSLIMLKVLYFYFKN